MKNKFKNSEKGFALPLALLLLVVMTIMGLTLVTITSNEHKANTDKDSNQQVFYAAESGIAIAKKYISDNINTIVSGSPSNLETRGLKFCKASFFPNLRSSIGFHFDSKSLNEVITASGAEATRLGKFSFEYFIAYSPDVNGNNSSAKKKSGTNNTLYTIYSCGCNEAKDKCNTQSNIIVPLEAVVTLIN